MRRAQGLTLCFYLTLDTEYQIPDTKPMPLKLKSGSVFSFFLVSIVILAALAAGAYVGLQKLGFLTISQSEEAGGTKFQKDTILRSYDFKDSKGKKKNFVVIKKGESSGIPVADAYITDKNLSLTNSVKIEELSGDANLGYAASGVNSLGTRLVFSVSPGDKNKVLMVEITVGDASTITLIDENGKTVSVSVVDNILKSVENKCKCSFVFDSWKGNDKFLVNVPTQSNGQYRAVVSAETGQLINGVEKI